MKVRRNVFIWFPVVVVLFSAWITACGNKNTGPQNVSPTATPTPYSGPTYSLSGSVTYNGGDTVGAGNPVYVVLSTSALFQNSVNAAVTLTSANGTYNFTNLSPGTYYIGALYDTNGSWKPFSNSPPPVGDYYYVYGGGSNGCTINSAVGVTVSGNTVGPALVFGNNCSFTLTNSLSGAVTYTPGGVSASNPIYVYLYTNPDILDGSPVAAVTLTANGSYNFSSLPTGNYYLVAVYSTGTVATHYVPISGYYDVYGGSSGGCGLVSSTPVFVSGSTTGPALVFGATCSYNAATTLSGPISYTGSGTVGTNHKIWVMLFNTSDIVGGGGPVTYASFTSANAAYSFNSMPIGPYYLIAVYDASGTWTGPGGNPPPSGDSYYAYGGGDGGCDFDPTGVIVNGNTAGPALVFGDSCKYNSSLTLTGSVNYTGGGTVNATDAVYVMLFNSPNISPNSNAKMLAAVTLTSASGTYNFPVTSGTYYLVAIYNAGGGGWYPGGSGGPPNGDSYTAYGALNNGCDLYSNLSPVNVVGNTTGPALSFGNSCQIANYNISGAVTLASADGVPGSSAPVYVFAFSDPSAPFSTVWSGLVTQVTSMTYDGSANYYASYSLSGVTPGVYYVGAFFDSSNGANYNGGSNWSVPSGEFASYYDGLADGGTCTTSSFVPVTVTSANVNLSNGVSIGGTCTTP